MIQETNSATPILMENNRGDILPDELSLTSSEDDPLATLTTISESDTDNDIRQDELVIVTPMIFLVQVMKKEISAMNKVMAVFTGLMK